MIFYRINITPGNDEGDEDQDEWFTSEKEARKRRTWLIKNVGDDAVTGKNYSINRVELAEDLPFKELLLAVLNRKGFICSSVEIVPAWRKSKAQEARERRAYEEKLQAEERAYQAQLRGDLSS